MGTKRVGSPMPSAPKKSSACKKTLSPEEQDLLFKSRREAIEKRLVRLHAKIEKDQALLKKYILPSPPSSSSDEIAEEQDTQ
jgi:hypothetical protein